MKHNVGSYDAGIRFVGGCLVMLVGVHTEHWWGLLGVIPVVTAVCGFCPLYLPFHIDTTSVDEPHPH